MASEAGEPVYQPVLAAIDEVIARHPGAHRRLPGGKEGGIQLPCRAGHEEDPGKADPAELNRMLAEALKRRRRDTACT